MRLIFNIQSASRLIRDNYYYKHLAIITFENDLSIQCVHQKLKIYKSSFSVKHN